MNKSTPNSPAPIADQSNHDKPFSLRRADDGAVVLQRNGTETRVNLHLCFPWSSPSRFLSLRDDDKKELALVDDLSDLPGDSRKILESMIVEARFVFPITAIESADADFELRVWKIRTRGGPRQFQTKLDDWPRSLPDGGLLLRDIAGDLYHVEDPEKLDQKSRQILWAFKD